MPVACCFPTPFLDGEDFVDETVAVVWLCTMPEWKPALLFYLHLHWRHRLPIPVHRGRHRASSPFPHTCYLSVWSWPQESTHIEYRISIEIRYSIWVLSCRYSHILYITQVCWTFFLSNDCYSDIICLHYIPCAVIFHRRICTLSYYRDSLFIELNNKTLLIFMQFQQSILNQMAHTPKFNPFYFVVK